MGRPTLCLQMELNSREGAWERLYQERDPLVLSSLMWAWLEQLREPVISREDVEALEEKNYSPQQALDSLGKVDGTAATRTAGNFLIRLYSRKYLFVNQIPPC